MDMDSAKHALPPTLTALGKGPRRIAVFSHSHPFYTRGGGEIVAYNSYKKLVDDGHDAIFVSAINLDLKADVSIFHDDETLIEYEPREYIFPVKNFESFFQTNWHMPHDVVDRMVELLTQRRIDIVHFHHFWNIGLNVVLALRNRMPKLRFGITLHEYLSICHRDGQMVKNGSNALCMKASDIDCHMCFPQHNRDHFRARRDLFIEFLEMFDIVVSPSEFLADRVANNGYTKDIYIIENGLERPPAQTESRDPKALSRSFAFFGQPSPFKGIDLFVAAAARVVQSGRRDLSFAVHGCTKAKFTETFGAHWGPLVDSLGPVLQFQGVYEPQHVYSLMRQSGYIVIPSIWWENSPLVIQEAFIAGRVPIVSNIGGMAEKVVPGTTGLHFTARNATSLADTILSVGGNAPKWEQFVANAMMPPTMTEMNDAIIDLYDELPAASA
jgi:glycosyltransferase involved in cell wall biosynthesis